MEEPGQSAPTVQQAVHGYRKGHQLLASSAPLHDDLAVLLANLSDSASRARSSDGPYLTGYGRADGVYVLARTWPVVGAERPNTVITRSLIIPAKTVGKVDVGFLEGLLTEPDPAFRDLEPVPVSPMKPERLSLSRVDAGVAASFYLRPRPIGGLDAAGRERVALAIWSQLWTPARQEFWFCTVPDTQRFEDRTRALRFTSEGWLDSGLADINLRLRATIEDLIDPGPFRVFVHFVGSGQRSASLMPMFDEAFRLLDDADSSAVERFVSLLHDGDASQPDRLRRLKRRAIGFDHGRPRWRVDPIALLIELATGSLGEYILMADASLDRWFPIWWESDPVRAASLIGAAKAPEIDVPLDRRTAREGLSEAFASSASVFITAETLRIAAEIAPSAVRRALWERASESMWEAWVELPNRSWFLDEPHAGTVFAPAIRALRTQPDPLRDFLKKHPSAVEVLVDEIVREPRAADANVSLPKDASKRLRQLLDDGDPRSGAILRIADLGHLPRSLPDSVMALATASPDLAGTAAAYVVARSGNGEVLGTHGALAFARLYEALLAPGIDATWAQLSDVVAGDSSSWDRCGRLASDFAKHVRGKPSLAVESLLASVNGQSPRAASALAGLLNADAPHRSWWFNPFSP